MLFPDRIVCTEEDEVSIFLFLIKVELICSVTQSTKYMLAGFGCPQPAKILNAFLFSFLRQSDLPEYQSDD